MRKIAVLAAISAMALAMTAPAVAAPAPGAPVMVVKLKGADRESVGGAAVIMARINNASAAFCQGTNRPREMALYADTLRCRREMAEKAVHQLDAPRVTALYNGTARVLLARR